MKSGSIPEATARLINHIKKTGRRGQAGLTDLDITPFVAPLTENGDREQPGTAKAARQNEK